MCSEIVHRLTHTIRRVDRYCAELFAKAREKKSPLKVVICRSINGRTVLPAPQQLLGNIVLFVNFCANDELGADSTSRATIVVSFFLGGRF